jgi:hypothetical protein
MTFSNSPTEAECRYCYRSSLIKNLIGFRRDRREAVFLLRLEIA